MIRKPPLPPPHFFGREAYVNRIVHIIQTCHESGRGARLVVRGYGGIGKTSVTLAVCHHPTVHELFGDLRCFVRCEAAETPALLLREIASCLQISISQGDAYSLVMTGLKRMSITQPLLLILDNAETFLYHSDGKEIDAILSEISAIRNITLILTKRGVDNPIAVQWDKMEELAVLSLEAARKTFLSITEHDSADSDCAGIDLLLTALDCVPLAVSLLARVAQSSKVGLDRLQVRWSRRKTDLLGLHGRLGDREASVSTSIDVSLRSRLMEENEHAQRLLTIISYLPEGILVAHIDKLSARWDANVDDAEHLLTQLSLAHKSSNERFLTTLSPIREHISRRHPITGSDLKLLQTWHLELANKGECGPGDPAFCSTQVELAINQNNISFILQRMIERDKIDRDAIDAVLNVSRFLYWSAPNAHLLRLLLSSQHFELMESKIRARLQFQLQDILRMQNDNIGARTAALRAREEFQKIGDSLGMAQCTRRLGDIHYMQSDYSGARDALEQARSQFEILGDRLGSAQCTQSLGDIHYMQSDYSNAHDKLERSRSEFEMLGERLGAAQCIKSLGNIHYMQSDYSNAEVKLEWACSEFKSLGDLLGAAQCTRRLGDIRGIQLDYLDAQVKLEHARSDFEVLGDRLGMAQCTQSLGVIHYMQHEYFIAQVKIEQAHSDFEELGDRLGAAQCIQSLGEIFYKQSDYSISKVKLELAHSEFENLGNHVGTAQCIRRLGNIYEMQKDYAKATSFFKKAQVKFDSIGATAEVNYCAGMLAYITRVRSKADFVSFVASPIL
jgi:tetratricopeptide (TPR) repeat protein